MFEQKEGKPEENQRLTEQTRTGNKESEKWEWKGKSAENTWKRIKWLDRRTSEGRRHIRLLHFMSRLVSCKRHNSREVSAVSFFYNHSVSIT